VQLLTDVDPALDVPLHGHAVHPLVPFVLLP